MLSKADEKREKDRRKTRQEERVIVNSVWRRGELTREGKQKNRACIGVILPPLFLRFKKNHFDLLLKFIFTFGLSLNVSLSFLINFVLLFRQLQTVPNPKLLNHVFPFIHTNVFIDEKTSLTATSMNTDTQHKNKWTKPSRTKGPFVSLEPSIVGSKPLGSPSANRDSTLEPARRSFLLRYDIIEVRAR